MITRGIIRKLLLSSLTVLSCLVYKCAGQVSQFDLPGRPLIHYPGLQVDSEGRTFVAAGNQLLRLSSDLVVEQNVSLAYRAVNISISPEGERLMVCKADLSCVVYNTSDLTVETIGTGIALLSADSVAIISIEGSFYVGSYVLGMGSSLRGTIRLSQYIYGDGSNSVIRQTDYVVGTSSFTRNFLSGFESGGFVYFIVYDPNIDEQAFRVMRVCHATGCPGNNTSCGFTAFYEEDIKCGGTTSRFGDGACGVSVVEDFGGTSGTSMILSRCRQDSTFSNMVCSFNLSSVDSNMDMRLDGCKNETIFDVEVSWVGVAFLCSSLVFTNKCDFSKPLGDVTSDTNDQLVLEKIIGTPIVDIGSGLGDITVTLALIVDGVSLVVAGYSRDTRTSHFVGFFEVTGTRVSLDSVFYERNFSSLVRSLQWHSGLDYIMAATQSQVVRLPLEECSSNMDCSSCVGTSNPLCGWCVVEDKCSRVSMCRDGNSISSTRWIQTNPSDNSSNLCIIYSVTPKQFLLDNQEVLSVAVSGPGLPDLLPAESYSCHLAESEGRFNITVPAVTVNIGTSYTCNITDRVPSYSGITAVINFSFVSSLANVPFATTNAAMTIYRCSATSRCSDCLQTVNACGWCVVNKLCRGTAADCTNSTNFLQLGGGQIFEDVCPLLDLKDGISNYTLPVRIDTALRLTTRNLPPTGSGFIYTCSIGGTSVMATRSNDTTITCHVNSNQLMISGATVEAELDIIWCNSVDIAHPIDSLSSVIVTLYDCRIKAVDCSSCVGTRYNSGFLCGWCEGTMPQCSVMEECTSSLFDISGTECPFPTITSISPTSGPPEGGTTITITGTDLGVSLADFNAPSGISINGIACTPLDRDYISGRQVLCETGTTSAGSYSVVVQLPRNTGTASARSSLFEVVAATVVSVEPTFGPLAGGSVLTISGTNLNIGNSATVRVNGNSGPECSDVSRIAARITCTTPNVTSISRSPSLVVVQIDKQMISDPAIIFIYRNNPNFSSIEPQFTIPSGGVNITFTGTDLDVARNPQLIFNGGASPCTIVSSTSLTCLAPVVTASTNIVMYELKLDNAPSPDFTRPNFLLLVRPDPFVSKLITQSVNAGSDSSFVDIEGVNLDSVAMVELSVLVGGKLCGLQSVMESKILCTPPDSPELDDQETALVNVTIGRNLVFPLADRLRYVSSGSFDANVIIPAVVCSVIFIFLCCVVLIIAIICYSSKQGKKKAQQYTNLIAKMELLEYEMADECKRAFTELQTDLADLVQISDKNLPYRDFRTFAMRFLFPKAGSKHPVLCPLVIDGIKLPEKDVMMHLQSFQELILDKKFLLVFVRTLEAEGSFSLQDKCNVASLLMVAFQNDLDYATDILQTLMAEMMRKTIAKSHPKLLLRRTESVAEKMLANWLAFLLFPYLLDHVGEPLFILFRAIKSQLEKGPVDVVTGEAKNSLSEEKLLRQHMDVKAVEGMILHEEEEMPIKLWDCDTVTQAKEKILDVLYRNTPVSKRPQLTEIDLELVGKGVNGVILRDQDATNANDSTGWVKINTLGHYRLEEMSKSHEDSPKNPIPMFKLVPRHDRPLSGYKYDTLGTIIANISIADRSSKNMLTGELGNKYHLVKPEVDDGDGTGNKIMSEVFLTRLLSTKRILQPYVDRLFEAIFAVPHGKLMPKGIKCLFDFLDMQAAELGITDSEVLHSWKTNSVPLRFWVNVIKNPDFVFDINKSATVDSCLTIIAQAYIDSTSTADIRYTKDTPSARLLYVNEVKRYRPSVESYYSSVQALPKLTHSDLEEYLRETTQTRKLYFFTESALFELFKFAAEYSDSIIDALNEEGLALLAAGFDQIRKAMS